MKDFERSEREEKLPAREIDRAAGETAPAPRVERHHGKLYRWFDNFWYHHKWKTIAALFVSVVVLVCTLQMCSRAPEADLDVVVVGPYGFTDDSESYKALQACLATYLAEDYNEDGEKSVKLVSYDVYSREEIEALKNKVDENGEPAGIEVSTYQNTESWKGFQDYLKTGEVTLLFASPFVFEQLAGKGLADISELADTLPAGAILSGDACFGVRLGDTAFYRENRAVREALSEDTVICLMQPTVIGNKNDEARYNQAIALFLAITE